MLIRHLQRLILACAMLPLLVQPALAHVVWFEYEDGEYELVFGHPEEGPESYDLNKFQSATAYDRNRQEVPIEINKEGDAVSIDPQGEIAALTAFYDNGYYRSLDGGSENISPEQAAAVEYEDVSRYLKYTKALYDWSEPVAQPFNLPLEIVPLENPLAVPTGEALPIKVLYQGQQINDALVEYQGETVDVNNEGIAFIPVGEAGLQPIEASYTSPRDKAPGISHATTLTAEAVPEPSALLGLGAFSLLAFIGKKRQKNVNREA